MRIVSKKKGFGVIVNDHNIELPIYFSTCQKANQVWLDTPDHVKERLNSHADRSGDFPKWVRMYFRSKSDVDFPEIIDSEGGK